MDVKDAKKAKVPAHDPWAKATVAPSEIAGTTPGFVYTLLCPRDYRGTALDDARAKLTSDGYERDEKAFSPHMPDAEAWRRPQALADEDWRVKLFDLARRRDYAEHLLAHDKAAPAWFRDAVFGFHGMQGARKRSLDDLKKACKLFPVHEDDSPRI